MPQYHCSKCRNPLSERELGVCTFCATTAASSTFPKEENPLFTRDCVYCQKPMRINSPYCKQCQENGIPEILQSAEDTRLSKSFHVSSGKTLKLTIKKDTPIVNAITDAMEHLRPSSCPHSRIEFKYGPFYIVVARLKDDPHA